MELDRNQHQGLFGEIFIRALAVAAGMTVSKTEPDVTGDDFTLGYPGELSGVVYPKVEVQVKSWSRPKYDDDFWRYPMRVAHFNMLAGANYALPRFLFLVIVPDDISEFTMAEPRQLFLRHSAYWTSFRDHKRIDPIKQQSVTIQVPRRNILTVPSLLDLTKSAFPMEVA
jgi:Domain of unknown function (DUF4365)